MFKEFAGNFLGNTPLWYKATILAFLAVNPLVFYFVGPFAAGWLLLTEFILTLALALKCYPVPSGGLLAMEAVIMGLASPQGVYAEVSANLPTLLLLIFMVAGIYYLKDIIFLLFTKIFIVIRKKSVLSLVFCVISASISAFLDALTLMAVIIAVCFNLFAIYHRVEGTLAEGGGEKARQAAAEMEEFRGFLRNMVMHGAVGTILGGTMTLVGEPHNMMIGSIMNWSFGDFFAHCSIISLPVAAAGFLLCPLLEIVRFPGFGYTLSDKAHRIITSDYEKKARQMNSRNMYLYSVQCVAAVLLILALAFHVAEIGLIGLALIIVLTAFGGMTKEHDFAGAFSNAMPFVTLLVVFFAILAVVHEQRLVAPLVAWVFEFEGRAQLLALFFVNGTLSFVSDNVFVASVFINEVSGAYRDGLFALDWYEKLAVVVDMGTNIPAMATPNGHAAFLFLLTSSLAPLLKLSYVRMVKLALPYTIVTTATGALAIYFFL